MYTVTAPCTNVANVATICPNTSGDGTNTPSPAFQMAGDQSCISLGILDSADYYLINSSDPTQGLKIIYGNGDIYECAAPRQVIYQMICDTTQPIMNGPDAIVMNDQPCVYQINWRTPLACPSQNKSGICPLVVPTTTQFAWQLDEIGAIGHFNMETFQGCNLGSTHDELGSGIPIVPPPQVFAPTDVDTDQWVKALASFGVKHAVLVISHGCGFNTFPSRTNFSTPDFQFVYNYSVVNSPWKNGTGDIAAEFIQSCAKYGIKPGFYLGIMNNAFLGVSGGQVGQYPPVPNQAIVTQDQYVQIVMAQLTQAWTDYGELAEIWFDGGYPPGTADQIASLLKELQPNAVAFQGPGSNIIRWVGTESGHPSYPIWSTARGSWDYGSGIISGKVWTPAEVDTCFQTPKTNANLSAPYPGCWFYNEEDVPKSLDELVSIYHDSVGQNGYLLLDWTPMPEGTLRDDHITAYQQFGDYLRSCYGTPIASTYGSKVITLTLSLPGLVTIDRFIIQEDQSVGQRILGFEILVVQEDGSWLQVYSGSSVGNKHIAMLPSKMTTSQAQLHILQQAAPVTITNFAVYYCTSPSEWLASQ